MSIPVHLIAGFLGAGKTTAIRSQLEARMGERIAVVVNDFGEASLDEAALAESEPFRITNIPGGCVCCTAPEGFVDALGAVLEGRPDRILIEPTGLARPQDLIDTIRRCPHREALELGPVVVLVDPKALGMLEDGDSLAGALVHEQMQVADVLVANRVDQCGDPDLERFRALAADLWPAPLAVHETEHGRLPPDALHWPEGEGARADRARTSAPRHAHDHDHEPDSTAGFRARSWQWAPDVVFSHARLTGALQRIAAGEAGAEVARLKGIFRTQEGVSRLEIAGGVLHDRLTSFRRDSRADAIVASRDDAALARIGELLEAAVLDATELRLDANRIEVVLPDGRVHGIDRDQLLALPDPVDDVSALFPKRSGSAARVRALFAELDVPKAGTAIVVAGDGFASDPVDLEILAEGLLLHSQAGEPLPDDQGGPFRLLIPDEASAEPVSCANVKGVAKMVVRG